MDDNRRIAHAVGYSNEIPPHLKPFTDFLGDFNKESDRGAVLASAAYIDDLLGQSLSAFIVEDAQKKELVDDGPLSTLSSRIMMCHALGLISSMERNECNLIRKVRNVFAHAVRMSFDDATVEGLCGSLKLSVGPVENVKPNTRMRYQTAAVAMILRLTNRPHYVGQAQLKVQAWQF